MHTFFVREIPDDQRYNLRLDEELAIIRKFDFEEYFLKIQKILSLTPDIPHLTRGSAGSSLVCYLLGITDIDPIKENISMTRFMHEYRDDTPDVDIDYPYHLRDEVFDRIFGVYGDRVARVSNHITYKRKSAFREALRVRGIKGLPKDYQITDYLNDEEARRVTEEAKSLIGRVRGTSLHCGGIVVLDEKIESKHLLRPGQLKYDKREVEKLGWLKIDILSNRCLSQVYEIDKKRIEDYPEHDEKTQKLLAAGDTLGVTQAESPAFRKMLRALKPKNRTEMSIAMALIRPAAASRGRKGTFYEDWDSARSSDMIVFEDDAIRLISKLLDIPESQADRYRRGFAKGSQFVIDEFSKLIDSHPNKQTILFDLSQLREFSLCKAHAVSYAKMVWALAYQKAHNPHKFWEATLNHAQSMYRHWVHVEEAKKSGLKVTVGSGNYRLNGNELIAEGAQLSLFPDALTEYMKYKAWSREDFPKFAYYKEKRSKVEFSGLVGTYRRMVKEDGQTVTFATIGVPTGLIDIVLYGYYSLHNFDVITGIGVKKELRGSTWIQVDDFKVTKIGK